MIQRDAPSRNMKEFIENQQYREDQLDDNCNLGNFMIEPKKNIYETIYNDMKNYINNIEENMRLYYMIAPYIVNHTMIL